MRALVGAWVGGFLQLWLWNWARMMVELDRTVSFSTCIQAPEPSWLDHALRSFLPVLGAIVAIRSGRQREVQLSRRTTSVALGFVSVEGVVIGLAVGFLIAFVLDVCVDLPPAAVCLCMLGGALWLGRRWAAAEALVALAS